MADERWYSGLAWETGEIVELIKILKMLGSNHDGEVLNAARIAHKHVEALGGWEVVIGAPPQPPSGVNRASVGEKALRDKELKAAYDNGFAAAVKAGQKVRTTNWRQWAKDLVDEQEDCLSDWEIKFFGGFGNGKFYVPTAKQRAVFEKVAARLDLELPE